MKSIDYYRRCYTSNSNFNYGKDYIKLCNAEKSGYGIYINKDKEMVSVSNEGFEYHYKIEPLFDAVCIYQPQSNLIIAGKTYSIYKSNNTSSQVFASNYEFTYMPNNWFVSVDEWEKLSDSERTNFIKKMKDKYYEKEISMQKELEETEKAKKLKKEEENRIQKELELISNVSKTIGNNTSISKTITKICIPKKIFYSYLFISCATSILGACFTYLPLALFGLFLCIFTIVSNALNNEKASETMEINVEYYDKIKSQNNLSLEMLGKIKQIENYIVILYYKKIDEDIIKLLKQSIDMTIYFPTNDEYYQANKKELDEKLNEFLDNTIMYIKQLLDNKDMEKSYLEKSMVKDYLQMIDKNNELFKSVIKDNHYLTDIFKTEQNKDNDSVEDRHC